MIFTDNLDRSIIENLIQTMINITQLSSNFMHELISNNQVQIVYNSYNELFINSILNI